MDNIDFDRWDEDRYRELNQYFRVKIKVMLESDPYLQELLAKDNSMQLTDLIDRMPHEDQLLWKEFLELDRIKLHHDMQNHLEGRGTPYNSRTGFTNRSDDNDDSMW
ncbi:MAG: hypothetical protein LPK19_01905 [Hymenobacteraceae bacterium]|nr:hypothetical protein [Hymenobacteraceae bacterium]MDX5394932.1 hypothetical protein [Hymenobacteraceae bacterium]MDX5510965.1 hypothetical protein [Hymenobacteraceae bacterium]